MLEYATKKVCSTYINALHYGTLQIQPYCPGSVIYLFPDSTHCASFSIVIPVFSQRQKYLMSKSQNCAIQFIHQIPSFFVIIQKQKLSISSLSELVKKAESPKILLLNFFREINFTKNCFHEKFNFFTVIIIKCMYIIASRHTNFFILVLIDIIFVNFIMGLIIDVRRFIVLI